MVATELAAVSRNVFAFSRDQALAPVFAKLSKQQVPVNATILVVSCAGSSIFWSSPSFNESDYFDIVPSQLFLDY